MDIDRILQRVKPGRTVHGIAAALLPFESDGRIAVDAFQQRLHVTHRAGLTNAVNMDTVGAVYDRPQSFIDAYQRAAPIFPLHKASHQPIQSIRLEQDCS